MKYPTRLSDAVHILTFIALNRRRSLCWMPIGQ